MSKLFFGTDGMRGPFGVPPMNLPHVEALAEGLVKMLSADGKKLSIFVIRDTRSSGLILLRRIARVLGRHGGEVVDGGVLPTAAAALVNDGEWPLSLILSASHNPASDNGIKIMSDQGRKMSDSWEAELEKHMSQWLVDHPEGFGPEADDLSQAPAKPLDNPQQRYQEAIRKAIKVPSLDGLHLALDTANGSASEVAPGIFEALGAKVSVTANHPDGDNINHQCGSTYPTRLRQFISDSGADLGFAFDGDADRCLAMTPAGEVVDGDVILFHLTRAAKAAGRLKGGVVGTIMSNGWLPQALENEGIEFVRSPVGDRYVLAELEKRGWHLGGEASGHILDLDRLATGDGLLTALDLLLALQNTCGVEKVLAGINSFPQILINVPVKEKVPLSQVPAVALLVAEAEAALVGGRVSVRYSGTENKLRIMVEGQEEKAVERWSKSLAQAIPKELMGGKS